MERNTAKWSEVRAGRGEDIPALSHEEMAALMVLQRDEALDFYGELLAEDKPMCLGER